MNPTSSRWKPKLHFDTEPRPKHVTFDDGKKKRRNLSWQQFAEALWDYDEPDLLKVEIGGWLIEIRGQNLGPLFAAIEGAALVRVRAQPDLEGDEKRSLETFVTGISFSKKPPAASDGIPKTTW